MTAENWNSRYINGDTGWDIGYVSTPLKAYFDTLTDKYQKILIPGGGNSYEAEYLHQQGFTQVYLLDWAPLALENLKKRIPDFPADHLLVADFFEHTGQYDLIVEQTFFCAIDKSLRAKYAGHAASLLKPGGKLMGVMFNAPMNTDHPPFGGDATEYRSYFEPHFNIIHMEPCQNSIAPRAGKELFVEMSVSA